MSRAAIALRGAGALLLVGLAVVLALTARDVLAWRGQTARANVAVARFSSDPRVWEPHTWLPGVVSRTLLGTGDDVRFGRALQRLQVLRAESDCPPGTSTNPVFKLNQINPCGNFDPPRVELANLELVFENIARSAPDRSVRSRAQELYTLVLFQQLLLQGANGTNVVDALTQSIEGLQRAVKIDPRNAEAAYDVEALLDLYRPIAVEEASQLPYHRGKRGDTGAAGGSPGASAAGAGGF